MLAKSFYVVLLLIGLAFFWEGFCQLCYERNFVGAYKNLIGGFIMAIPFIVCSCNNGIAEKIKEWSCWMLLFLGFALDLRGFFVWITSDAFNGAAGYFLFGTIMMVPLGLYHFRRKIGIFSPSPAPCKIIAGDKEYDPTQNG